MSTRYGSIKIPMKTRKIDQLTPHPNQQQLWGDLPGDQLERLKESIEKHGQRDPIDIDEDGRILDGHQRWRVAQDLGLSEVQVRVVSDAVGAEELFLSANLTRRQLGPIQRARVAKAIVDRRQAAQRSWERREGELRKEIARILGISVRQVSRMLQLLRLPVAIQNAVDQGALTQNLALKVERLPESAQLEIANAISDGEDAGVAAREVLEDYADPEPENQHSKTTEVTKKYQELIKFLETDLCELEDRVMDIAGTARAKTPVAQLIDSAINTLSAIRDREQQLVRVRQEAFVSKLDELF